MKILTIDDNYDNLITLKAIFSDVLPDAVVFTALNGPDGLALALSQDPDVILLDVLMPGMDGYEVCKRFKTDPRLLTIPVIFVTALRADKPSRMKALEVGAEGFLTKPIDEVELVAQVKVMAKIKAAAQAQQKEKERLAALVAERTVALEQANEAALNLAEDLSEENKARMATEAALVESEAQYRTLFTEMIDGFALHEIITNDQGVAIDYVTLEVNRAYESLLDCPRERVVGKRASEILPQSELQRWLDIFGPVALTGTSMHYEMYSPLNDRYFQGEAYSPRAGKFAVSFTDITERKQAEEALASERNTMRTLIDALPSSVYIKDLSGRFRLANRATAELVGKLDPHDLVGLSDSDLFAQAPARDYWQIEQRAMDTGEPILNVEGALTDAAGRNRWFMSSKVPLRNEQGSVIGLVGVSTDITERKQVEEALQASKRMLEEIINAIPVRVFWKDLNFVYLGCNAEFARDAGFVNPSDIVGKDDSQMGWRDQAELYRNDDRQVIESGLPKLFIEESQTTPDGSTISLLASKIPLRNSTGEITGVLGIYLDITERKQAEEALRTSEEQHRAILRTAMDGFCMVDMGGKIVDVNEAYCQMTGYSQQELLVMSIPDLAEPGSAGMVADHIQRVITDGGSRFETRHRRKDGNVFDAEFSVQHLSSHGGRMAAFIRDITERNQAEEALREAQALLSAAMDNSDVGIAIADSPSGKLRYVNDAGLLIRGEDRQTIVNDIGIDKYVATWNILDLDGTPLPSDQVPLTRAIMFGEKCSREFIIRRTAGEDRTVLAKAAPILDANGLVSAGIVVFLDITERKQAEEALAESHALLENLARLVPGVIYQYRLYPDGRSAFPYASPGMYGIYEVTPEEVREDASAVFGRLHPEDSARVKEAIWESARTLNTFYCEFRVILPGQGLRWRWSQAQPERTEDGGTLWYGIISDITERKQTEEALREGEERLNRIIEGAQTGTWEYNVQTGQTVVNETWAAICGYTLDKVSDYTINKWASLVHPDDVKQAISLLSLHYSGELPYYDCEYRIKHKDGYWVWVNDRGRVVSYTDDGEPLMMFGTHTDITKRKLAEEALRSSERDLQESQRIAHIGSWRLDVATNQVVWTDELYNMYGFDPSLPPPPYTEHMKLFAPESWQRLSTALAHTRETGIPYTLELQTIRKDGSNGWMWVHGESTTDSTGKIVGLRGAAQEITERRQAEEALRVTNARLELAMQSANIAWWDMNTADGSVTFGIQKATMLGYPPEQFTHYKDFRALVHPDDYQQAMDAMRGHLEGRLDAYRAEYRIQTREHGYMWFYDIGHVTRVEGDGKPSHVTGLVIDITERKQAENRILRDESRLKSIVSVLQFHSESVQGFLDHALNEALQLTESQLGYIYFYHEDRQQFVLNTWSRQVMHECTIRDPQVIYDLDKTGIWGEAVRQRKPIILNDYLAENPLKKGYPDGHARLDRFMTVPVFKGEQIVAVVGVANKSSDYDDTDVLQLTLLMEAVWKSVDVTRAQEALRESEEKHRRLFETMTDGVIYRGADGRVISANPAAERILGQTIEQLRDGVEVKDGIVIREDGTEIPAEEHATYLALRTGKPVLGFIQGMVFPHQNKTVWVSVNVVPIFQPGDALPYQVYATISDITERKQAEESLRESEEKHRRLFETMTEGVLYRDADGRITSANPAAERFFGRSLAQLRENGQVPDRVIREDGSLLAMDERPTFVALRTGKPVLNFIEGFEFPDRTSVAWVTTNAIPIFNPGESQPVQVYATFYDITEQRNAEQALRESEEKHRRLFETMTEGVVYRDAEGKVISVNSAAERILGQTLEQMTGKTVVSDQVIREDGTDYPVEERPTFVALHTGRPVLNCVQGLVNPQDNTVVWISANTVPLFKPGETTPFQVYVTVRDITERKQAEEALRESEEKYRLLVSTAGEAVVVVQDNQIKLVNTMGITLMGASSEQDVLNLPFRDFVHPQDHDTVLASYRQQLVQQDGKPARYTFRVIAMDGAIKWVENNQALIDWQGQMAVICLLTDITERKRAQEALRESEERQHRIQLSEQQRRLEIEQKAAQELRQKADELARSNRDLQQFAYVSSHDLQEPLRMVASYTELLAERYQGRLDGQADKYIAYAVEGAVRIQQLIHALLDFNKVGTRNKPLEEIACADLVRDAVQRLGEVITENQAQLIVGELPTVMADRILLEQVFEHLVDNAIKFRSEAPPRVEITSRRNGGNWEFCVADNGIGIAPRFQERLFIIFNRLHERGKYIGVGIGLPTCKKIIELHGGRIWVESEEGEGARFWFTLPVLAGG